MTTALPPAVSAVQVSAHPGGGGWRLGVVGKRTWLVARGRCVLAPRQVPLVSAPVYDEERAVLLHDADVILNRARTDVVIDGHVYPPDGKTPFDCGLQIGAARRLACAFGPRSVARGLSSGLRFSPPARVERIALSWENAYGGVDQAMRADVGDPFEEVDREAGLAPDPRFGLFAYPRNPVGRGYLIEPTSPAIEACALPLLEDPGMLLTPANLVRGDFVRWPCGPPVAAFGWLSCATFPRSAGLGAPPLVYDGDHIPPSAFFEVTRGELPAASVRPERPLAERLAATAGQSAAIGMRFPVVKPGDPVALHGLHPRELRWTFTLPAPAPRMAVRFAGEKALELPPPEIRTVFIQPDEDRLTLVWTAELDLVSPPSPRRLDGLQHVVLWQ